MQEVELRKQFKTIAPPLGTPEYVEWLKKAGASINFRFKEISRARGF